MWKEFGSRVAIHLFQCNAVLFSVRLTQPTSEHGILSVASMVSMCQWRQHHVEWQFWWPNIIFKCLTSSVNRSRGETAALSLPQFRSSNLERTFSVSPPQIRVVKNTIVNVVETMYEFLSMFSGLASVTTEFQKENSQQKVKSSFLEGETGFVECCQRVLEI